MADALSERPTMTEAFAADVSAAPDSQAGTPSSDSTEATSASADAIVPQADGSPEGATPADSQTGEPPKERWPDILANTRTKARDEALAEWRQQHGWAERVDRAAVEQAMQIGQLYQQDRAGFIRQVLSDALGVEDLAPLVRSEAARVLGRRQAPEVDLTPDVPVMDANGNVVTKTYSADRMQAIVQQAIADALQREVGPLKQTVESVAAERAHVAQLQAADRTAEQMYQSAQAWPGFKAHEQAIGAEWAKHDDWTLQDAYIAVVVPQLQAAEKAKTLDELKTQAAASTVNPAAATVSTTKRPRSLTDPSLKWS